MKSKNKNEQNIANLTSFIFKQQSLALEYFPKHFTKQQETYAIRTLK